MKIPKVAELSIGRTLSWLLVCAAAPLLVTVSCATARLDPMRNQALTFDTVSAGDAGALPGEAVSLPPKTSPSQLAQSVEPKSSTVTDAGVAGEPLTCTVDPPDPKPSHTREWVAYAFVYEEGAVRAQSQRRESTTKPRDSARVVGRYAVELWIGCELVDRVRFGFPLQGAERPKTLGSRHPLNEQPSLTEKARLTTTVRVPLDPRATRAELVDRGTGKRSTLAWPPDLTASKPETQKKPANLPKRAPATGSQSDAGAP